MALKVRIVVTLYGEREGLAGSPEVHLGAKEILFLDAGCGYTNVFTLQ